MFVLVEVRGNLSVHENEDELKKGILRGSPRFGMRAAVAKLQTNMKTHKQTQYVQSTVIPDERVV